jgi:hypothetical protein
MYLLCRKYYNVTFLYILILALLIVNINERVTDANSLAEETDY